MSENDDRPELPEDWEWKTIGDVAEVIRGVTYKKAQVKEEPEAGYLPLLRSGNVKAELDLQSKLVFVPEGLVRDDQRLQEGDVVVSVSNSRELVGKAASLPQPWTGTFGAFLGVVRPDPSKVDRQFLAQYFGTPIYRARIATVSAATNNIANIRKSHLLEMDLPLPPLDIQRALSRELDRTLAEIEGGGRLISEALSRITSLERRLIDQAIWSSDENPSDGRMRKQLGFEREIALRSLTGRKRPAVPPSKTVQESGGREVVSIDEACSVVTDGDHNPPKRHPDGVPHLTAKNVRDFRLHFDDTTFISEADFERVARRYRPLAGDVIVTCVGTIGRCAVVPEDCRFSPDRNLAGLRPLPSINPKFLLYVLASGPMQARMSQASGSTAQPHLYLGDLRGLPIPAPVRQIQDRIVVELDRQLAALASVRSQALAVSRKKRSLQRAVLSAAFAGRIKVDENSRFPANAGAP